MLCHEYPSEPTENGLKILFGLIASKGIQVVAALVALRLSTSLLDTREMGSLYVLRSICAFFSLFLINPITQFALRRTPAWNRAGVMWSNFRLVHGYFLGVTIVAALIALLAGHAGVGKGIPLFWFIVLTGGGVYFGALHQWFSITLNLLEAQMAFSLQNALAAVCMLIFPVWAVVSWTSSGFAWFLGQAAGTLIMSLLTLFMLRRLFPPLRPADAPPATPLSRSRLSILWTFSGPLFLNTFFIWAQTSGYQLVLEQAAGLEFLGLMGLGFAIAANIAGIVESIVTQFLSPALIQKADLLDQPGRTLAFGRFFHQTVPVYLALGIFVSFLAEPIAVLLVAEKMRACYTFAVFGIWVEGFRMTTGILNTASLMEMKTRIALTPQITGGLLALGGTIVLSFFSGFETLLPYWLVFSGMFLAFHMCYNIRRLLPFPLELKAFVTVLLYSLPFSLAIYGKPYWNTKLGAIVTLGLAGSYFALLLYRIFPRSTT
jgi:hypothetical protein